MLSGAPFERLPVGLQLMKAGLAPNLVVSTSDVGFPEFGSLCETTEYRVFCHDVGEDTQSEVHSVAGLAHSEGWKQLVVVTSDYHVVRSRLLFRWCYKGKVAVVGTNNRPWDGHVDLAAQVGREWLGLVKAFATGGRC